MTFIDNRVKVKTALKEAGIAWLYEACGEIVSQTVRNSRRKTSKTAGSFKFAVDEDRLEGAVGSNYDNAIWEEFGTGEYALNGDGRKGGWFYVDERGKGHFTHGKKPTRAFFKAFASTQKALQNRAKEIFKDKLGG